MSVGRLALIKIISLDYCQSGVPLENGRALGKLLYLAMINFDPGHPTTYAARRDRGKSRRGAARCRTGLDT